MVPVADAITKHNTTGGVPLSYDYWSVLLHEHRYRTWTIIQLFMPAKFLQIPVRYFSPKYKK